MRAKASNQLNIKMSKGVYRFKVKGIYGENYQTLKKASQQLQPVKVKKKEMVSQLLKRKRNTVILSCQWYMLKECMQWQMESL